MKKILNIVLFLPVLFICSCDKPEEDYSALLALLLLGGGGTPAPTYSLGNLTNTTTIAGDTYNFSISKTNVSDSISASVYLSTNSTITGSDTLVGVISITSGSGSQSVNVTIPAGAVGTNTPSAFYVGLILTGGDTIASTDRVMVFPVGSAITAYSVNSAPLTGQTLDGTTTQQYYEIDFVNGVDIVASAFQVAGGLDVIGNVFTVNGGLTDMDDYGADDFERLPLNVTATQKAWIQIRRYGSTAGSFTFFANDSGITGGSLATGGGSCIGGTGVFTDRCVDYETGYVGAPTNDSQCVSIQGTGSVYSSGTCTTTNRVARCHVLPFGNPGRIILTFYSPETLATASSVCGSDILTVP